MRRALLLVCCLLLLPVSAWAQNASPDEVFVWKAYGEYLRNDRDTKEGLVATLQATVDMLRRQLDEQKKLVETLTKKLEEKK